MRSLRHSFPIAAIILAAAASAVAGSFTAPAGLQLYSLRAQFTKSVPAAIEMTKNLGVRDVETAGTYGLEPAKLRSMLTAAGLNPVSGHFGYDQWKNDPAAAVKEAKELGLKFAGTAWISHKAPLTEIAAREAVETFNKAGAACAKEGIQFFYHVHGYEFQPWKDGTLMDLLIKESDPKWVAFEMDTTWIFFPGQDPAAWLRKYPGRWQLMHMKDLKKGVARGSLSGGTDPNNDVPLGTGQLNWPEILKAAQETGVKHYFIEDEAATAPEQIPQSLKYLRDVKW